MRRYHATPTSWSHRTIRPCAGLLRVDSRASTHFLGRGALFDDGQTAALNAFCPVGTQGTVWIIDTFGHARVA